MVFLARLECSCSGREVFPSSRDVVSHPGDDPLLSITFLLRLSQGGCHTEDSPWDERAGASLQRRRPRTETDPLWSSRCPSPILPTLATSSENPSCPRGSGADVVCSRLAGPTYDWRRCASFLSQQTEFFYVVLIRAASATRSLKISFPVHLNQTNKLVTT